PPRHERPDRGRRRAPARLGAVARRRARPRARRRAGALGGLRLMARIGIIAAVGGSGRTGLRADTTKAALRLGGNAIVPHQIDFLRASGADRALVVARPEHARLLGEVFEPEDRLFAALVLSDKTAGWADTLDRTRAFIDGNDEVAILSCDNLHTASRVE